MKIRIRGNSVRYRLSKTDVDILTRKGYHEEQTSFGTTQFRYALQRKNDTDSLLAEYEDNTITVYMPAGFLENWATNEVVGIDGYMSIGEESLYLLVEKDFKCLDKTHESQEDNYDNPNQTC